MNPWLIAYLIGVPLTMFFLSIFGWMDDKKTSSLVALIMVGFTWPIFFPIIIGTYIRKKRHNN